MKSDICAFTCTSMYCNNYGCDYCRECSHARYKDSGVDKRGKEWRWEFRPILGPVFLRKDGEWMKRQPVEGSNAWETFRLWYRKGWGKEWVELLMG